MMSLPLICDSRLRGAEVKHTSLWLSVIWRHMLLADELHSLSYTAIACTLTDPGHLIVRNNRLHWIHLECAEW